MFPRIFIVIALWVQQLCGTLAAQKADCQIHDPSNFAVELMWLEPMTGGEELTKYLKRDLTKFKEGLTDEIEKTHMGTVRYGFARYANELPSKDSPCINVIGKLAFAEEIEWGKKQNAEVSGKPGTVSSLEVASGKDDEKGEPAFLGMTLAANDDNIGWTWEDRNSTEGYIIRIMVVVVDEKKDPSDPPQEPSDPPQEPSDPPQEPSDPPKDSSKDPPKGKEPSVDSSILPRNVIGLRRLFGKDDKDTCKATPPELKAVVNTFDQKNIQLIVLSTKDAYKAWETSLKSFTVDTALDTLKFDPMSNHYKQIKDAFYKIICKASEKTTTSTSTEATKTSPPPPQTDPSTNGTQTSTSGTINLNISAFFAVVIVAFSAFVA